MEKYNEVIKQLKEVRGLKNAFTVKYNIAEDNIHLNFNKTKTYQKLKAGHCKMFREFSFVLDMNDCDYLFLYNDTIKVFFD